MRMRGLVGLDESGIGELKLGRYSIRCDIGGYFQGSPHQSARFRGIFHLHSCPHACAEKFCKLLGFQFDSLVPSTQNDPLSGYLSPENPP